MKKIFLCICLFGAAFFPMWAYAALSKPSITSVEVNMTEAYYIASSAKPRCQCYLTLTAPVDGALGYEVKTQTGVIRFHDSTQTRFAINAIVPYPNTKYDVQIRALGATESDASDWSDVYELTSGPKIGPDVDTWFGTTETTAAGTTYYYYGIAVASQLDQIASSISDTATPLLVADIDMGGRQLTKAYMTTRQSGTLGMGFMVDNFTINTEGTAGQAAFIGAQIRGVKTYGMIIGPRARIKGGFGQTGGLIAYSYGRVEASMNYAKVTGSPFVTSADNGGMGGIAAVGLFRAGANINFGQIECYGDNAETWDETLVRAAHGRYTPAGVGGIAGNNPISVFISNINMGRVDGRLAKGPVGGIVGDNRYAPSPTSTQNAIPNLIANLNAGEISSVAGQSNVGLIGGLSSSCAVKYNLTTGNASSLPFSTGGELYGNQIKSLTEINTSTFCPSFPNATTVSSGWRSDDAWVTGTAFGYSSSTAYPKPVELFRTRPDIVRALDASMDIIPVNANVAGAVTLDVLANDRDPENKSTFKIVSVTQPNKYGSVEMINDGQAVRYTPNIPQNVKGKFIYAYFDYVIEETSPNGQFQGIPYKRKQDARVFLTIMPENDAPAFSPSPLTLSNQSAGYALDYDLSTHVTDEYPCTYALIGTSGWASISASGKLSGVPPLEKSGTTETLNVRITDVMGVETNVVVTIPLVRGENVPPVASVATFQLPGAVSDANDGRYATQVANSVNLSSKFSDADGHTLTYSVRNAPSWCSINASTGVLSFTAPQSRDAEKAYEIQVVATDTYSTSAELTVQFSIVYNEAPVWNTKCPEMVGGKPYFLFPTAFNSISYAVLPYRVSLLDICQDPEGDALKFRAEGQTIYWGFPAYDTRSARTESYATWWTAFHVWQGENIDGIVSSQRDVPRGNLEGRWTVRAYDKWGTYADCTINIPVASPGEVTNYAPVFLLKEYSFDAFVNQPYSQSVALAYDFAASTVRIPQPLTYSSSDAPAWLTVAADGTITGTPPAAGTYTFTLKAQDPGIGNKQDDAAPLSATTKIVISVQNQVIDMTGMLGEDLWNYYTFDTDKAAHATLGSDHTSLATGDTTAYTASAGKFGNALVGAGGFKTATGSYSLYQPNATNFTFSAWFKRGAAVTVSTPLIARGARVGTSGNDYTHNSGWSLFRTASGEVVLRVRDKNKTVDLSVTSRDTPFASNFGNYVHVAWTREGDVATLYVNGVAQGTITGLAGKDIAVVTDQWWREFMAGTDSAAQPSAAMASGDGIDDMAMWKRALAANEVAMIASSQVPLANIAYKAPSQADPSTGPFSSFVTTAAWTALPWQDSNENDVPANLWTNTISAATLTMSADATVTLDRSITLGMLTLSGTGVLTVTAETSQTLIARIRVLGGALKVENASVLGASSLSLEGGSLDVGETFLTRTTLVKNPIGTLVAKIGIGKCQIINVDPDFVFPHEGFIVNLFDTNGNPIAVDNTKFTIESGVLCYTNYPEENWVSRGENQKEYELPEGAKTPATSQVSVSWIRIVIEDGKLKISLEENTTIDERRGTIVLRDENGNALYTVNVTQSADGSESYKEWMRGYVPAAGMQNTSLTSSYASDGMTNLAKYVLGSDPTTPAGAFGRPEILTFNAGGQDEMNYFILRFPYNSAAAGVTLSAEYLEDPDAETPTWTSASNKISLRKTETEIVITLQPQISAGPSKQAVRLTGTLDGKTFTTEPYGYELISVPAKTTKKFGLRVHKPFIFQKEIPAETNPLPLEIGTGVDADKVTILDADLPAKIRVGKSYIVEILTAGESAGTRVSTPFIVNRNAWRGITDMTTDEAAGTVTFVCANLVDYLNVPANAATIVGYRIREASMLSDVFGSAAESGLKTGTSRTADMVKYHILDKNLWSFWVNSRNVFDAGSLNGESVDPAATPIFYHRPIQVQRRENAVLSFILAGEVLTEAQGIHVYKSDGNISSGLLFGGNEAISKPTEEGKVKIESKL